MLCLRSIHHLAAAFALVPGAAACGLETDGARDPAITTEAAGLEVASVTFTTNDALHREHCRVHTSRWTATNGANRWNSGTQLLIFRGDTLRGMCTVDGLAHSDGGVDEIRVHSESLLRRVALASDGNAPTTVTGVTVRDHHSDGSPVPVVVSRTTNFAELDLDDNLAREYVHLPTSGAVPWTVYTAAHPWENFGPPDDRNGKTWTQLKRVKASWTATDGYWAVGVQGNDADLIVYPVGHNLTNAQRFHITSAEISDRSFPGLAEVIDRGARYAVAFHGTGTDGGTCDQGVKVGGSLGTESADRYVFRRGIAENLRALVDPTDPTPSNGATHLALVPAEIRYADGSCGNSLNGTEELNFVNRIATYQNGSAVVRRGLQLEGGGALDIEIYDRVARVVREVFDCLDGPADTTIGQMPLISATSNGTTYLGGRCRGFVVDVNLTQIADRTWTAGLATCTPGARAHVDFYRWNALALSWDRIGGGDMTYATVNGTCQATATAYDDPHDAAVPVFSPGAAGRAAGSYRAIVYGYNGTHFTATNALPVKVETQGSCTTGGCH